MKEYIDIYTKDRKRTGETVERGTFLQEGQYMLYVLALLENPNGKFLITQRALDKRWAAGWWEVTGGGVPCGEESETAVVREVAEETGLDVSELAVSPVYSYENVDLERGDNYIVDIYHFRFDFSESDVELQESEAIDFKLASWDEIEKLNESKQFLHFSRIQQALRAEGLL